MNNTILVVEDDAAICQVVSEYLMDADFTVLTASDGKAALNLIESGKDIDLFILDIMLPGHSGLELLKAIRETRDTPVIMLTALSDEFTQLLSFDGKADDYVTKPFSAKVLVKRVASLLRRAGKSGDCLKFENIVLDLDSYEAYEDDRKISLTLKELEILKVLITNGKKVLSRQQLLNLVWGYDYFGDERIVDVHIKNLRKKFNRELVDTVKGVGYRMHFLEE